MDSFILRLSATQLLVKENSVSHWSLTLNHGMCLRASAGLSGGVRPNRELSVSRSRGNITTKHHFILSPTERGWNLNQNTRMYNFWNPVSVPEMSLRWIKPLPARCGSCVRIHLYLCVWENSVLCVCRPASFLLWLYVEDSITNSDHSVADLSHVCVSVCVCVCVCARRRAVHIISIPHIDSLGWLRRTVANWIDE